MKYHGLFVLLLALAPAQAGFAQIAPAPDQPTAEQLTANDAAKTLGERIYRHDQAAWHASDALAAEINFADHPELRDYLTQELDDGKIALVYSAEIDGKLYEFARYVVDGSVVISGQVHAEPKDHPLSPELERQASARVAAREQGVREKLALCTASPPNFISLPPDESGQISVYITSSQEYPYQFPLGGHYLFKVNAGNQVVAGRAFAPGCFDVPIINEHVTNGPDDYPFAYIESQQPHEIHYFVSRNVNVPLAITAGNVLWTVGREASAAK